MSRSSQFPSFSNSASRLLDSISMLEYFNSWTWQVSNTGEPFSIPRPDRPIYRTMPLTFLGFGSTLGGTYPKLLVVSPISPLFHQWLLIGCIPLIVGSYRECFGWQYSSLLLSTVTDFFAWVWMNFAAFQYSSIPILSYKYKG